MVPRNIPNGPPRTTTRRGGDPFQRMSDHHKNQLASNIAGGLVYATRSAQRRMLAVHVRGAFPCSPELAPHGILVRGVAPGLVDAEFDPLCEEAGRAHAESLPPGRLGTLEDVTSAFILLASEEAEYRCGQLMHRNGGDIVP